MYIVYSLMLAPAGASGRHVVVPSDESLGLPGERVLQWQWKMDRKALAGAGTTAAVQNIEKAPCRSDTTTVVLSKDEDYQGSEGRRSCSSLG